MHVVLTSDQEALRSTTARFLDERMPPTAIRGLRGDPTGFDASYWAQGAELGWTSLLVDEEHGGGTVSGSPVDDLALIAYEFGAHAAPGPLVPVNVVTFALSAVGTPAQHQQLESLMSGSATAAWCYAEPAPNDRLGDIELTIRPDGNDLLVSGVKRPVENGGAADLFLVTGRTESGLSQALVSATTPGVCVTPLRSADLTRRFAEVRFDEVRVGTDALVGVLGEADRQVAAQERVAVATHNAETIGAMQRAFEMTSAWVADRYSFGRPLASYQEIKHRFADMLSWLEASHAINDNALAAIHADSSDAGELTSAAKAFVGHYGAELVQDCVQLHGGIGVTYEHDLHLFLRRVTVNRACFGTPAEHQQRVGLIAATRKDEARA
jgi:alkylation response protein AidB-like acyl-CoA dehydrogenase